MKRQAPLTIWTVLESGEGNGTIVNSGFHHVKCMGYLISNEPVPPDSEIVVQADTGPEAYTREDIEQQILDGDWEMYRHPNEDDPEDWLVSELKGFREDYAARATSEEIKALPEWAFFSRTDFPLPLQYPDDFHAMITAVCCYRQLELEAMSVEELLEIWTDEGRDELTYDPATETFKVVG